MNDVRIAIPLIRINKMNYYIRCYLRSYVGLGLSNSGIHRIGQTNLSSKKKLQNEQSLRYKFAFFDQQINLLRQFYLEELSIDLHNSKIPRYFPPP
jgi:hypothetical protein